MNKLKHLSKCNLFYSFCIFVNHFAFGICSTITWPALVDLGYIYAANDRAISLLATFSSLGYLVGSLSGSLYRWLNRQLTLSLLVMCIAITLVFFPHYPHLWTLFGAFTLNGIGGGAWDSSNNVWLVDNFNQIPGAVAPLIQCSQFMYGLGSIFGPIIVAKFVFGENTNTTSWTPEERKRSLTVPFAAAGALQIIVPIILFILFFIRPWKKNDKSESNEIQTTAVENANVTYRPLKLTLMALSLSFYSSAELGYFNFSSTAFQFLDIKLPADEAAVLQSLLAASYTAGRLVTALISIKLQPDIIMLYHYCIILVAHLMLFFGRDSKTLIYVGTVILGYAFSAMWPSFLALSEKYLRLTNRAGAVLYFFNGFVSLFNPLIVGPYLNSKPLVLFLFEACYIGFSFALFVVLRIVIRKPLRIFNNY